MMVRSLMVVLLVAGMLLGVPVAGANGALVTYYDFEDGTGSSTLTDQQGTLNGTLTNMDPNTDWVAGKKGSALNFAGGVANAGEFVATTGMPPGMEFDGDEAFTWSGWIAFTDLTPGALTGVGNNGSGWQQGEKQFYMSNGNTGTVNGQVPSIVGWGNDWILPNSSQTVPNDGQWHHVAIVHDNTGGADGQTYIDGVQVAAYTRNAYAANRGNVAGSAVRIAYTNQGESPHNFEGSMDEIGFFDNALTAGEVASIPGVMNDPTLQYGLGDSGTLIDVFRTGTPDTVGWLTWNQAPDGTFTGSPGDVVTVGSTIGVIMNGNGGGVSAIIPEPSTFLLATMGLLSLALAARRKRRQ